MYIEKFMLIQILPGYFFKTSGEVSVGSVGHESWIGIHRANLPEFRRLITGFLQQLSCGCLRWFFTGIYNCRFRKPVVPGDQVVFEVEITNSRKTFAKMRGRALVDGKVVCEADLMSAMADRS